jgi:hypothetical protein
LRYADLSSVRFFRLSPGGMECDEGGLRIGDVALLARNEKGAWVARDEHDLCRGLTAFQWMYAPRWLA